MAEALDRALSMDLDERKMRMNQLKNREKRMDVDAWVRGFMAGMSTLYPHSVPGNTYNFTHTVWKIQNFTHTFSQSGRERFRVRRHAGKMSDFGEKSDFDE